MRTLTFASLLGLVFCGGNGLGQDKTREPEVKFGKYKDLADLVVKHRGKVVVVDFWFTT